VFALARDVEKLLALSSADQNLGCGVALVAKYRLNSDRQVGKGIDYARPDVLGYFTDWTLPLAPHRYISQLGALFAHGQHLVDLMSVIGAEEGLRHIDSFASSGRYRHGTSPVAAHEQVGEGLALRVSKHPGSCLDRRQFSC